MSPNDENGEPENVVIPIPEFVSAIFVVPLGRPLEDPRRMVLALASEILEEPFVDIVSQVLSGDLTIIDVMPSSEAPPLPASMVEAMGASEQDVRRLADAPFTAIVQVSFFPGMQPLHELAARIAAAALADGDVPLVDAHVPRLVTRDELLDKLPLAGDGALVDLLLVLQSPGDTGLWQTTDGLGRFGLPELQARNVPMHLSDPWTSVMNGLARALLVRFGELLDEVEDMPAFMELPELVQVTAQDIAAAYGANPDEIEAADFGDGVATLRLTYEVGDPDEQPFLTVLPPRDYPASTGEFMVSVCESLYGGRESEVQFLEDDEEMEAAMASARAELHEVWRRFTSGELPLGHTLILKHRHGVSMGVEYLWMSVTSWKSADRVHGTSMHEALDDPEIRTGRPIVVDRENVVDWAELSVEGVIVAGGRTQEIALARAEDQTPT